MCKAMMDSGEKHKPNLSLILPKSVEEFRRYTWTNPQVSEWTTHPGQSSHSPGHMYRETQPALLQPPSYPHCAMRGAWSKEIPEQEQNIQLKFYLRLHRSDSFQRVLLPPRDRKGQVTEVLKFRLESQKPWGSHFLQNYSVVLQLRSSLNSKRKKINFLDEGPQSWCHIAKKFRNRFYRVQEDCNPACELHSPFSRNLPLPSALLDAAKSWTTQISRW